MPVCKDFVVRCNVSLQRFHFFNGIFLGRWYPEGFHAKSMVLKRFAPLAVFSPPNLKEEILDVRAPVSIISVFTVVQSYRSTSKRAGRHLPINSQNELCNLAHCRSLVLLQTKPSASFLQNHNIHHCSTASSFRTFFFFPPYTVRPITCCLDVPLRLRPVWFCIEP